MIRLRNEVLGLYPEEYVYSDASEAVELIDHLQCGEQGIAGHSDRLKAYVRERFDAPKVVAAWEQLIRRLSPEG